jgi:hypothetical protein
MIAQENDFVRRIDLVMTPDVLSNNIAPLVFWRFDHAIAGCVALILGHPWPLIRKLVKSRACIKYNTRIIINNGLVDGSMRPRRGEQRSY